MSAFDPNAAKTKIRSSLAKADTGTWTPSDRTTVDTEIDELTKELAKLQNEVKSNQTTINTLKNSLNASSAATIDLGDTNAINAYLRGLETSGSSWEQQREKLSEEARKQLGTGALLPQSLRDTTISEEIEYNRMRKPDDKCCKLDSNVLNSIPEFTGESETEWRNFEQAWMVAICNHKVDEGALMTALMPRLKGKAKTFYMAESVRMTSWNFAETMQRLRDRYREEKLQAENRIAGMCQGKDTVRDFAARIQVAAYALYPAHPGKLKALMHSQGATIIPNPILAEETKDYFRMVEKAESSLMKIFMSGLRPDIQARLPSEIYTTFEQMIDGARKAEWIQGGINAGMLQKCSNPLYQIEGDECNALQIKGGQKKGKFDSKKSSQVTCWGCGGTGHIRAECKKSTPYEKGQGSGAMGPSRGGLRRGVFRRSFPRQSFNRFQRSGNQMTPRVRGFLRVQKFSGKRGTYRDPARRRWMTQNRARFNLRRRLEGHMHALEEDEVIEGENENYTQDERELFQLEHDMTEDEFREYMEEVTQEEEELESTLHQMETKN